jgi:thermostable 8-oxoguanine DNA glycosylase
MKGLIYLNEQGKPQFSEMALALEPFAKLWRRDKSPDKEIAFKELSFIILATDMSKRNTFREYSKEEKIRVLNQDIFEGTYDFKDEEFRAALKYAVERDKSLAKEYLSTGIASMYKVMQYLNELDLTERDPVTNKPIHNAKQYQEVAQNTAKGVVNLENLLKAVDSEDKEGATIRGGGEEELDF